MAHPPRRTFARRACASAVLTVMLTFCVTGAVAQSQAWNEVTPIAAARVDADGDLVPDRLGDTLTVAGRAATASGVYHSRRLHVPLYSPSDTTGLFLSASEVSQPIVRGDSVVATGTIGQYNGLTQLHVHRYDLVDVPPSTIEPRSVSVVEAHSERFEGAPVRLIGRVVDSSENRGGVYLVLNEPEGSTRTISVFVAHGHPLSERFGDFEIGDRIEAAGVVSQYDYEPPYDNFYQLLPRSEAELSRIGLSRRLFRRLGYAVAIALLLALLGVAVLRRQVRRQTRDLAKSEERFRQLSEATFEGIVIHQERRIVDVNQSMADLLDCSCDDLRGRFVDELFAPDAVPRWRERVAADDGRPCELTVAFRDTTFPAEIRIRTMAPGGRSLYVTAVRDVTERHETEKALRQKKHHLRMVVANTPVVLFALDAAGRFTLVEGKGLSRINPGFADLVGVSIFSHAREMPVFVEAMSRALGGEIVQAEVTGEEGHFEVYLNPVKDAGDAVQGVIGVAIDISERKEYERGLLDAKERAEEMSRLKSSFLTNMSHEIRTPLTAILGFTDILVEQVDDENVDLVEPVRESGRRLMDTLNSVLDLAQLDSGSVELYPGPVDVGHLVRETVAMFRPQARERGLRLSSEVEDETPVEAHADAVALGRVLDNLLSNAIKFTDEGEVHVRVRADAEHASIRVEDTGVGFEEAFLPHLFREFEQESAGLTRAYEGSGLGLAISKRLVELMGGTIEARSQKGEGSVFVVRLPLATDAPVRGRRVETPPDDVVQASGVELVDGRAARLLIVEDQPESARVTELMLRSYETDVAATPDEALALVQAKRYDGLLVDFNLKSARTGLDVLEEVRRLPGYEGVPAVAVTAYALNGDRERLLAAGFDGYVSKPFDRVRLRAEVRRVVGPPLAETA